MEPPREGGSEMAAALGAAKQALRAELRQRLRALGAAEKQRQSRLLSRKGPSSSGKEWGSGAGIEGPDGKHVVRVPDGWW